MKFNWRMHPIVAITVMIFLAFGMNFLAEKNLTAKFE